MKKLKPIQIIGILAVFLLFGARMYTSYLQEQERKKQQQLIYDLSRMQLEQQMEADKQRADDAMRVILEDTKQNLDSMQTAMDSLRIKLEEDSKRFQEQFGTSDTN